MLVLFYYMLFIVFKLVSGLYYKVDEPSVFGNDFFEDNDIDLISNYSDTVGIEPVVRTLETRQLKADVSDLKNLLKNEMNDLSPEIHDKIESTIKSSDVDRNKYRDIFIIRKRIISDGNKEITKFDIKERIIPKEIFYSIWPNTYVGVLFWVSIILLLMLLITTTRKMCQTLVNIDFKK